MDLGLGNLNDLKTHLLNESLRTADTYDTVIALIGRGTAARMEGYCGRKFTRVVADTFDCPADRDHLALPRYPVESVASVALRENIDTGFIAEADAIDNLVLEAGLIYFGAQLGGWRDRLRITYTGGYWYETLEPGDGGYPTAQPVGSNIVPHALKLAWLLQCERIWSVRDNLGANVTGEKAVAFVTNTLAGLELVPEVKAMLGDFRRLSLQ